MIDASLKDTAAMTMGADMNAFLTDSVEDELGILGLEMVETLLNDMVAVEVLDEQNNSVIKGADDGINLKM